MLPLIAPAGAIGPGGDTSLALPGAWLVVQIGADAVTAVCCLWISATVIWALRKRDDLYYKYVMQLFAALVSVFGVTRAWNVVNLGPPAGMVATVGHGVTALVALTVAIKLRSAARAALSRPSRVQLRAVQEGLERRVAERTEELTRANARLAEQEASFRALYQVTPIMMHSFDREGRLQDISDFWAQQLGYAREEAIGRRVQDFVAAAPAPDGQARLRTQLWETGSWDRVRHTLLRKDGSTFEVEFSGVIHGEDARARAFVVGVDVTAREAAEQASRENAAELQRANEGLAQFAYVASHDLQEPLRKIAVFSDILAHAVESEDKDDIAYALPVIRDAAVRARQLVQDLLAFSRYANAEMELSRVEVGELIAATTRDLSLTIEQMKASVSIEVAPSLGEVEADRSHFAQVLANIISNSLKYHKPGIPPSVHISAAATPDGALRVEVKDEGIGFDPQFALAIFEPFKRLQSRKDYPGSGIGLAICKTICERHGWSLSATAIPDQGATFSVLIPRPQLHPAGDRSSASTCASRSLPKNI